MVDSMSKHAFAIWFIVILIILTIVIPGLFWFIMLCVKLIQYII